MAQRNDYDDAEPSAGSFGLCGLVLRAALGVFYKMINRVYIPPWPVCCNMAQRRPVSVSPALTLSTNTVAKRAFEMQMTFLRMMTFRYVVLVAIRCGATERDGERS